MTQIESSRDAPRLRRGAGRPDRTDDASHFHASIDLRELAKLAGRDPDDIGGTYDVVAATFASPTVAEASSPTITVVR